MPPVIVHAIFVIYFITSFLKNSFSYFIWITCFLWELPTILGGGLPFLWQHWTHFICIVWIETNNSWPNGRPTLLLWWSPQSVATFLHDLRLWARCLRIKTGPTRDGFPRRALRGSGDLAKPSGFPLIWHWFVWSLVIVALRMVTALYT